MKSGILKVAAMTTIDFSLLAGCSKSDTADTKAAEPLKIGISKIVSHY